MLIISYEYAKGYHLKVMYDMCVRTLTHAHKLTHTGLKQQVFNNRVYLLHYDYIVIYDTAAGERDVCIFMSKLSIFPCVCVSVCV